MVISAERGKGGVMKKTAPTCRNHTAEGKEQDDYEACVSHHAGEVKTRDYQKSFSSVHTTQDHHLKSTDREAVIFFSLVLEFTFLFTFFLFSSSAHK